MAKMTREAAIELLRNKKVYVNGKSAEIQKKLFELGWKWSNNKQEVLHCDVPFLFIYGHFEFTQNGDMIYFTKHELTEISADEIISIEITESLKENDVVVSGYGNEYGEYKWMSVVKNGNALKYNYKATAGCDRIEKLQFDNYCDAQQWTRPATEEEKQKLLDALKASKKSRAKEILKKVFGIEEKPECPFKPFDKVLARNENSQVWTITFFDKYDSINNSFYPFYTLNGTFKQCIPYEGNEHLKDTTNSPEE